MYTVRVSLQNPAFSGAGTLFVQRFVLMLRAQGHTPA